MKTLTGAYQGTSGAVTLILAIDPRPVGQCPAGQVERTERRWTRRDARYKKTKKAQEILPRGTPAEAGRDRLQAGPGRRGSAAKDFHHSAEALHEGRAIRHTTVVPPGGACHSSILTATRRSG